MKQLSLPLNLPSSVSLSAVLHVVIFFAILWTGRVEQSPLPIGVEVQFGDSFEAPMKDEKAAAKTSPQPTVANDDSDAPSLSSQVEKPVVTASADAGKKMGNPEGLSERGVLTGREGVANGQEVSPEERYRFELQKLLERKKQYPLMAKKLGQTGQVRVRFVINKDGSLSATEVIERAPYDSLNRAAHDLVKSIHGMKPFPVEIQKASLEFTVPVDYSLN